MISYLRGEVASVADGYAVLDVGGVGYRVFISPRTAAGLPPAGSEAKLFTYLSVREDALWLYGFLTGDDLEVFRELITVSGVGPKAAMGLLGAMSANDLRFAVFSDDEKAIARAPGIGPKTAKKLILELKDRLKLEDALPEGAGKSSGEGAAAVSAAQADASEAVQALIALGYSNSEALKAVQKIEVTADMTTQDILKTALKVIGL